MATWTLGAMETKFRDLTGMPSTSQILQATVFTLINDFYVEVFPLEANLPELKSISTSVITTADSDDGEYSCADTIIAIHQPIDLFNEDSEYLTKLTVYRDATLFFADYPRDPDISTGQPGSLLWWGLKFFLRPIADAIYTVDMAITSKPTTALTVAGSVPLSNSWGQAIAYGAALQKLSDLGDMERITEVAAGYKYHLNLLDAKEVAREMGSRSMPNF